MSFAELRRLEVCHNLQSTMRKVHSCDCNEFEVLGSIPLSLQWQNTMVTILFFVTWIDLPCAILDR